MSAASLRVASITNRWLILSLGNPPISKSSDSGSSEPAKPRVETPTPSAGTPAKPADRVNSNSASSAGLPAPALAVAGANAHPAFALNLNSCQSCSWWRPSSKGQPDFPIGRGWPLLRTSPQFEHPTFARITFMPHYSPPELSLPHLRTFRTKQV